MFVKFVFILLISSWNIIREQLFKLYSYVTLFLSVIELIRGRSAYMKKLDLID